MEAWPNAESFSCKQLPVTPNLLLVLCCQRIRVEQHELFKDSTLRQKERQMEHGPMLRISPAGSPLAQQEQRECCQ